jgi:hypothetical protein
MIKSPDAAALAARIVGRQAALPGSAAAWLECARANRVHLLLAGTIDRNNAADAPFADALRDEYRLAAARDAAEAMATAHLLEAAANHGVRPLLFKGCALAHVIYKRSFERPRVDTDIFIADEDAEAMRRALEAAGYTRPVAVDGALVTGQFQYSRTTRAPHDVDVHTRLFNPAAFARVIDWHEADARAIAVPALGRHARTLSMADALVVACLHRVAHHRGVSELLWLYDIDRIARVLGADDWQTFVSIAERAQVREVCASSLDATAAYFDTPLPADVRSRLSAARGEPSASFLRRGAGELPVQWLNLRHVPGWRERVALVRQHLFPPASYVLEKYGRRSRAWLPVLYSYRVITGAPRWLRGR